MLTLEHICFDAEGQQGILQDVSLTFGDRQLVVITGPNGGGKSTLAKIIAGIERPTSGCLLLDGEDITAQNVTERAKSGISIAFQQSVRFKGLTVRDLLSLADPGANETKLHGYLRDVGLCPLDYIDRELNTSLSGGEAKRVEIAMAFARGAKLTVFDEPEAGIDLWSFANLIEIFRELREMSHGPVVIISHQERILDIADEIVVLSGGKVSARGPKDDILPKLLSENDRCDFCRAREVG